MPMKGQKPPEHLEPPYTSFLDDPDMLAMLLEERPPVVSFHFGIPPSNTIERLLNAGIVLLATATNLHEARLMEEAGVHAIVAQGELNISK